MPDTTIDRPATRTVDGVCWGSVTPGRWAHTADDGTLFALIRDGDAWKVDRCRCPNPQVFWIEPSGDFASVVAEASRIVIEEGR